VAKQNVKIISIISPAMASAASAEAAGDTPGVDIQRLLEENLRQQYEFATERFQKALWYAIVATVGVILALLIFTGLNAFGVRRIPDTFQLYVPFYEWRTDGVKSPPVSLWSCEVVVQSTRLISSAADIGASMFIVDEQGNVQGSIAGIARLCTLIAVFFAVWFSYRKMLLRRYALHGHEAQRQDFEQLPRWQFWLTRTLYTFASLFGTYVVVSITWLAVGAMFKTLALDWFNAAIIVVLFTWAITFAATYASLAVTTRETLLLALSIFVIGFSASFALSPQLGDARKEWWQMAVSSAGQENPSAPLFTGTLLSGPLVLLALWFDLDSILQKMIGDGQVRLLKVNQWMWVTRILYGMLVLGFIFVGMIRVDEHNFRVNMVFHAGGAVMAILSAIFSGILIRKRHFHPWYRFLSNYVLIIATFTLGLLGVIQLNPLKFGAVGEGLVGMTVIELALFLLIGVWMYVTVDNLLGQADIKAFDGPLLVMARKE
jgi:hypothetical protein